MNPILIALGLLVGLFGGLAYFGALWRQLVRLPDQRRPGRWFVIGALVRATLAACALLGMAALGIEALLSAMLGFLLARSLARWRSARAQGASLWS